MFYTEKHRLQVAVMQHEIEFLKTDIRILQRKINNLTMAYPHGTTRTGEPRKKPGRKPKVTK